MIDLPVLAVVLGVAALLLVVVVALVLGLALRRARSGLAEALARQADLDLRVAELGREVASGDPHRVDDGEVSDRGGRPVGGDRATAGYVITRVGEEAPEPGSPARIEGRLFADLVLRETVVKAASLAHGVRRALAPEVRNRVAFEMRREVKRARRRRREELRELRREQHARDRAREVA